MDCVENENVCSVKKENNLGYYRLHTIWRKDGFLINITSKNGAWRGEMTPDDVTKMSIQLEMEPESYLNLCKEALTSHGGQPGMVYAVEDGAFAWKKVEDEDSGIKIKMGSVMLEPTNFVNTIQDLVTVALNCNKNLQEKLLEANEKKEQYLKSKNELLNKLNELIQTKEAMETDLYSRFMLLINTKKRKIQQLENSLEELKNKNSNLEILKNPYEMDTDEDSEKEVQTCQVEEVKKKGIEIARKSTRKSALRSEEVSEEKKVKNTSEDHTAENINIDCSDYFCEPSTSKLEPEKYTSLDIEDTKKNTRKSMLWSEEVPEEKKMKNTSEDDMTKKINIDCSGYSCEPSTSKLEPENYTHQPSLKEATTKDELYDFFYGDI